MKISERIDQVKQVPGCIWRWIKRVPGCSWRKIKSLFVGDSAVKPLHLTWTAWAAGLFPLILSATAAIFIYRNDPTLGGFSFTAEGFNQAFTHFFRVPLLLLSASVALLALVAYNHRSEQTARSIEEQQSQNRFSNYFTHIREFSEYARGEADRAKGGTKALEQFVVLRHVYRWFYPAASPSSGMLHLSEDRLAEIECIAGPVVTLRDVVTQMCHKYVTEEPSPQNDEASGFIVTHHHDELALALISLDVLGKICDPDYSVRDYVTPIAFAHSQSHCRLLAMLSIFDGSEVASRVRRAFLALDKDIEKIQQDFKRMKINIPKKPRDLLAEGDLRRLSGE